MFDTNKQAILQLLQKAQLSVFGLNRATGISFPVLRTALHDLEKGGYVKHDGVRFQLAEATHVLPQKS